MTNADNLEDYFGEYFVEYTKLSVIREVAKKNPNEILNWVLNTVDKIWDKEMQALQLPKKKAFVTKF